MIAISTSWNHTPSLNMRDWLGEVRDLGYQAVELGYTLTQSQLDDVLAYIQKENMKVTSIHNFCPIPDDYPSNRHPSNYYRLSALDDEERKRAILWTKRCIETAKSVDAKVVIIHAGTVEIDDDPSENLLELYAKGQSAQEKFIHMRNRLFEARAKKRAPFIEALEGSLRQVMEFAHKNGIKIGLETRYYPVEIPNFEEVDHFLNLFAKQGMYYWHDVGHAELNERLGIRSHLDFLNTYQDRMIGMHIHGMDVIRDHLAPFQGDLDLAPPLRFLKEGMIKVVEARYASADQLKEAYQRLS